MARVSTMVNAISFLWLKGWHAPAGRRTCEPRPLAQDGQIGPARRWVPQKTWDPADESLARQPERASAGSQARPGPRPPTLRPYHRKTAQAGPEAQPPSSLPNTSAERSRWIAVARRADHRFSRAAMCGLGLAMFSCWAGSADR